MDRRATAARLGAEDPSALPNLTVPLHRWDPVLGALDAATQAMREHHL